MQPIPGVSVSFARGAGVDPGPGILGVVHVTTPVNVAPVVERQPERLGVVVTSPDTRD